MNKQIILFTLLFIVFFIWHERDISIIHNNIKKVRKEAWFDSHELTDSDIVNIKFCLEHLESRIDEQYGPHSDYPNGYPLWEERKKKKKDPLFEALIDASL